MSVIKRSLSFTSEPPRDAVNEELAQAQGGLSLDAPTISESSASEKIKLTLNQCIPDNVCVFSDRAQVTRLVEFEAEKKEVNENEELGSFAGTTWVTIQGLPATCDDSSIRISKKTGTGTILEVFVENSTRELLKEDDKTEEDQEITDPEEKKKAIEKRNEKKKQIIEELVARQLELSQELERLIQKKDWMEGYASQQTHTESGINLSIDEAVEFLQFYNEQNQNFDQRKDEITEELTEIERKRASLVVFKKVKSVHLLLSKAEGGHLFSLSYVVNNAQWKPVYDLRVRTKDAQDDTIDLSYFGVITNSSGDHWENVSLSLSTAQPHVAGSPPPIKTVYVSIVRPQPVLAEAGLFDKKRKSSALVRRHSNDYENFRVATVEQSATSTTFKIPVISTIISDSQPRKVAIHVISLKSQFSYVIIPKLSEHAYLRSISTNQTTFPFLAGKANVFMGDTFVTNSELKNTNPGEELTLYLGADSTIVVQYKESLFRETKGIISKTSKTRYLHEISVKNSKKKEIQCIIFDQLPKSQDSDIKVSVIKPKIEEKEGDGVCTLNNMHNVKWQKAIKGGESYSIAFEFTVEHPSAKNIRFT